MITYVLIGILILILLLPLQVKRVEHNLELFLLIIALGASITLIIFGQSLSLLIYRGRAQRHQSEA